MDRYEEQYKKLVKEETVNVLESGQINEPQAQYNIINHSLKELLLIKEPKICDTIDKYFIDQELLQRQIESKQKELQILVDEYSNNVKEIYEGLIKKL